MTNHPKKPSLKAKVDPRPARGGGHEMTGRWVEGVLIRNDVPIPPLIGKRAIKRNGPRPSLPWHALEVGDSMFVAGASRTNMTARAAHFGAKLGRKFACWAVTEGGEAGIRVGRRT